MIYIENVFKKDYNNIILSYFSYFNVFLKCTFLKFLHNFHCTAAPPTQESRQSTSGLP